MAVTISSGRFELTGQEAVKLDEELQVDIVGLGSLAVRVAHVAVVDVDT